MGATYTRQKTYTDGDIIQASDTNDEFDQLLAAFASSTGHTHDGTTGEGGPITKLLGTGITIGDGTSATDITVTFDGETNDGELKWMEDEDYFEFSDDLLIASTEKIQFRDTAIFINSSTDGQLDIDADTELEITAPTVDINASTAVTVSNDLKLDSDAAVLGFGADNDVTLTHVADTGLLLNSTMALQFNDASQFINAPSATVLDINATDEIELNATLVDINGNVDISGTLTVAGALDFGDLDISNVGSIALDTITNDGTDITLDSSGDIILDADGGDVFVKDAGTTYGSLTNSSGNLVIKSGTTTALTFSGANATLAGDLTISGDDLTMATNTAGALLIADGTNFNPTVVGDLSEISTVANDDVFLAVDTSGGGLKKITRSAIVSGLASSGAISNVVEDTSPQLGGNLDTNSNNILIDDAHFIGDENGNEQIIFQTTSSAVNQFDVTNAATGNAPKLSTTGGDSNIDLELEAKGTGHLTVRGNTNAGAIQFNCESNSHGQIVQSQPHSAAVTNTMLLPAGSSSTLVSLVSTDTLTNKTLTSPKINEDVAVTATATELNVLDGITAVVGELNALDIGSTAVGTAVASKAVILDSDKDYTGIRNFTITGNLSVGGTTTVVNTVTMNAANAVVFEGATADAHETTLTIVDPTADRTINLPNQSGTIPVLAAASNTAITSTPAELNILDGVTSTATELNLIDGSSAGTIVNSKAVIYGSSGEVNATTLQIAGTSITSTAAELNILDGVTATTSELNLLDGGTSVGGSITLADADGFVVNDGGTMKTIPATDVKTYAAGSAATKGFAIAMAIVFG